MTDTRIEYGVIVDRTSDGLGTYLDTFTNEAVADAWVATAARRATADYPVTIKRRTVTYGEWVDVP